MSEGRRRLIETNQAGDVTVVRFTEKRILDEQNIQLIGEQLASLVEDDKKTKILLNFSNVDYLSSAALGKLLTLNKKVVSKSGQLKLCHIKPEIHEVFSITKLDKLFQIHPDEQRALDAFR